MPLSPEEFYAHALAAADGAGRLPLSRMTGWDISPFEPEGLRVSPLRPPVLPEPPPVGAGGRGAPPAAPPGPPGAPPPRRGPGGLRQLPRPRPRDLVRRSLATDPGHRRRGTAGPHALPARAS